MLEILNKSYKSNPDLLTDTELKMIGKYKPKNKVELPEIPKPVIVFLNLHHHLNQQNL